MSLFFNIKIYIDKIVYIIYNTIITRNIKKILRKGQYAK